MADLAITNISELVFGVAPRPVRCGLDLTVGAGLVFPEVNFTLPAIAISGDTWREILAQYDDMAKQILRRAFALRTPGIVLEFELLPAMTEHPEWGAEITALLKRRLVEAHDRYGLPCALRVTPTDMRDLSKPPRLRDGAGCDWLMRSIELCITAGADLISVESIGGKEVHDQALMYGDVRGCVFALGVLAPRDTAWLWTRIGRACERSGTTLPAGDSACGFANTAMQLANERMLPETLAATIRSMSSVRSLAAFEHGAIGPSKDCAYEGPVIKAITGRPISMEGKSAACAHFSPVGNIAAAMCDLWSNESVQNVRLLSGSAPAVFTEALAYDCRLMNTATARSGAIALRDFLTESDEWLSPQAAVLSPRATIAVASAIAAGQDHYASTIAAGLAAVSVLRSGLGENRLSLGPKEVRWLDRIEADLNALPKAEDELATEMSQTYAGIFDPESYGLPAASSDGRGAA